MEGTIRLVIKFGSLCNLYFNSNILNLLNFPFVCNNVVFREAARLFLKVTFLLFKARKTNNTSQL